jgi:transposase
MFDRSRAGSPIRERTSTVTRACLVNGWLVDWHDFGVSRFVLLSDAQWSLISDLMPGPTGKKGRPFADARSMVEGIVYRYRTGIAWRDLPAVFGAWQTVWAWHRRMAGDGTWDTVLNCLLSAADEAGAIDWSVSVDSTIARAHQHATNITRTTGGTIELHDSRARAA